MYPLFCERNDFAKVHSRYKSSTQTVLDTHRKVLGFTKKKDPTLRSQAIRSTNNIFKSLKFK